MQYKILYILIVVISLVGCTQKKNIYAKPTDTVKEQALTQAQKVVIRDGENIKAFVVITKIDKIKYETVIKDNNKERFVVGIHIQSDANKDLYNEISFSINGKKIVKPMSLDLKDPILKIVPAFTPWSKYFLVESPRDETKRGVVFGMVMSDFKPISVNFNDSYGNLPPMINIGFKTVVTTP